MEFTPKTKLIYHDRLDWVQSVKKTRQEIDVIDSTGAIYIENNTELSWSIGPGVDYDENQTG